MREKIAFGIRLQVGFLKAFKKVDVDVKILTSMSNIA